MTATALWHGKGSTLRDDHGVIATLPMYDRPETAAANDTLWSSVAKALGTDPCALTPGISPEVAWADPDLILSQTCGMPFKLWVKDDARYVASPDFRLPDTPPGYYHSVIIARADDPRPASDLLCARPIINQDHSQSGYNALWVYANARGTPLGSVLVSGSHHASAKAVAENTADVAAIDANTWRMITRWDLFATRLKVLARTPPTPAMPFICGPAQDPLCIRNALAEAIKTLTQEQQNTLGLYGLIVLSVDNYLAVPLPPNAQIAPTT